MSCSSPRKAKMVVWGMPSPQLDTCRILFIQLPSLYFESSNTHLTGFQFLPYNTLGPCLPHTLSSVSNPAYGCSDSVNVHMFVSTEIPSFRAFVYQHLVEGAPYQLWTTKSSVAVFSASMGLLLLWVGYYMLLPSNPATISDLTCHLDLFYLLHLEVMGDYWT